MGPSSGGIPDRWIETDGVGPAHMTQDGGVSNVDMDGNNTLYIKAIQVFISTFENTTLSYISECGSIGV
jgi:hypothetical protein